MRHLSLFLAPFLLFSTPVWAGQWVKEKAGTYEYMSTKVDKNVLTVECYTKPIPHLSLHYWPLCASSDCGTYIADDKQLGNVMLDKQLFSVGFLGGDTDDLTVVPKSAPEQVFIDALAQSKSITVYSAQIVPNSVTFKNIKNTEALQAYNASCLKPAVAAPAATAPAVQP